MSGFKKQDIELLAEAYEQVNEGIFDRLKARGSQAIGAVKGAGQQIAGKAQQAAGSLTSKAGDLAAKGVEAVGGTIDPSKNKLTQAGSSMQKAGSKQVSAGQRAGDEAKYKSYISNSAKTIATDLNKLGMAIGDEAALIQDLQATITKHLKNVTKSGQFRDSKGRIGGKVV
jgi:hypothetical protein